MKVNVQVIEKYIKENKTNKKEFCKMCGISFSTLQKFLYSEVRCNLLTAYKILIVLKCKFDELFYK